MGPYRYNRGKGWGKGPWGEHHQAGKAGKGGKSGKGWMTKIGGMEPTEARRLIRAAARQRQAADARAYREVQPLIPVPFVRTPARILLPPRSQFGLSFRGTQPSQNRSASPVVAQNDPTRPFSGHSTVKTEGNP